LYCDILKKEIKQRSIEDYIICIVNTENNVKLAQEYMVKFFPTSVILEPKIVKNLEQNIKIKMMYQKILKGN
jgi:hypothetical protein